MEQLNKHDILSLEPQMNSLINLQIKPVARKLDFDNSSPGLPKNSLSNLLITRSKRGQSDSYLLNSLYRKPCHLGQEIVPYIHLSPIEKGEKEVKPLSLGHRLSFHTTTQGLEHLAIKEESASSTCSIDSRGKCDEITPSSKGDADEFQMDRLMRNCSDEMKNLNLQDEQEKSLEIPQIYPLVLSICQNLKNPDLNTISSRTLVELINNSKNQSYLIIDCRYEYEYKGGHIKGAINIISPDMLEKLFFEHRNLICNVSVLEEIKDNLQGVISNPRKYSAFGEASTSTPPIIIFHCEFSQKRGPRAFRALRNLDRQMNSANWPHLSYPQIYVLEGGYRQFHTDFPMHCNPENAYVEMLASEYKAEYRNAREKEVRAWKKKLSVEIMSSKDIVKHCNPDC